MFYYFKREDFLKDFKLLKLIKKIRIMLMIVMNF